MRPAALSRPRERLAALAVAAGLVFFRSFVFLWWEQSHFDADQAIVGLMAKHLTEGRAFPLFFYGQQYLLGVESWLVAPFFALFGISVFTLKLPLLLMNLAAAAMLILGLERYAGVRPALGVLACLFFLVSPPGTASRLVQANGCNIEPFLYVVALWMLRERPVAFGLTAGLGFLHREFTAYGVSALLALELWQGTLFSRKRLGGLIVSALMALVVWEVVQALVPFASASGPGSSYADLQVLSHTAFVQDRFCWNPGEADDRAWLLVSQWLPQMFGARHEAITRVGVMSERFQGLDGLWLVLVAAMLLAAGRLCALEWRLRAAGRPAQGAMPDSAGGEHVAAAPEHPTSTPETGGWSSGFCAFLVLVGVQSAVVYAVMCGQRSHLTMRYMLLALLLPIGLSAWYLRREPVTGLRNLYAAVVLAWAFVSVWGHAGLMREYVAQPPPSDHRALASYLERRGITSGAAGFWDAYAVTFLSEERVRLASVDIVRITEYQAALDQPRAVAPLIATSPCDGEHVTRWWVCR
jgi:hypothetical protein